MKIRQLPGDTKVYCGHEYTLANARFAATIMPENKGLQADIASFEAARKSGTPTVPVLLSDEILRNPFLRADKDDIREALGMENVVGEKVFGKLRQMKDQF